MSIFRKFNDIALWVLLLIGFAYAVLVSYRNLSGDPCPSIGPVPACYLVLISYALMILSLIVSRNGGKQYLFAVGWGVAFIFAAMGSALEFFTPGGGVCPSSAGGALQSASQGASQATSQATSEAVSQAVSQAVSKGGVPMCYVSLALLVIILVLFLNGPHRAARKLRNVSG